MTCTRPDIFQTVGIVSRYTHNPGKGRWHNINWIIRYILGTVDVGLKFEQDKDLDQIEGYVDSDFASDLTKHHLVVMYFLLLLKAQ